MDALRIDCARIPEEDFLSAWQGNYYDDLLFLECTENRDIGKHVAGIYLNVKTAAQLRDYLTQFIDGQK